MSFFLPKIIINDPKALLDSQKRARLGRQTSAIGMAVNLLLFGGKLAVGLVSGSIAIVTDSVNNLSDAATSFINLFGFTWSAKPADKDHPFGHGRVEYVTGLIMSLLIILVGFEFLRTSVRRIIEPQDLSFSWFMPVILIVSILIKGWLFYYYRKIGRAMKSQAIMAASVDSISDMAITLVTLLALVASTLFNIHVNGYVGAAVALFVLYAGYTIAREALAPLLGRNPDPHIVDQISKILCSHESVLGVHQVIVHDYGPGRQMGSAHVEVSASQDLMSIHEIIDGLEREIVETLNVPITIHMDPIVTNDQQTNYMRKMVEEAAVSISVDLSAYDVRMVCGKKIIKLIFGLSIPIDFELDDADIVTLFKEKLAPQCDRKLDIVIECDRSYL